MTHRELFLRSIRFERPERIPVRFHINGACWHHYPPEALIEVMAGHPLLWPDFDAESFTVPAPPSGHASGEWFTDGWGSQWKSTDPGIAGVVMQPALEDWDAFDDYVMPDPEVTNGMGDHDWDDIRKRLEQQHADGFAVSGGLPHGHTFLRLTDLRGYENAIFDMVEEEPRLVRLLQMIEDFNLCLIRRHLDLPIDIMTYPEDLGMQVGPMLSPNQFRRWIKPAYQRLMRIARDRGIPVHMHSDGDIRTLVDDLIEGGVDAINLQDLVNGIDWIAEHLIGKACIDLDVDRQKITRFGSPEEIDALIRREVETLGSKEGGLMLNFGLYPGAPIENIRALADAMEKYSTHYSG